MTSLKPKTIEVHVLRDRLSYDPATGIFRWKVRPSNSVRVGSVAGHQAVQGKIIGIDGEHYFGRRLAWLYVHGSIPPGMEVRTINRDESDLRLCNLELSTLRQRMERHPKHNDNKSGVKGIWKETARGHTRYRTKLNRCGKTIHQSNHPTLEAAMAARAEALRAYEESHR